MDTDIFQAEAPRARGAWLTSGNARLRRVTSSLKLRLALGALLTLWAGMVLTTWHLASRATDETLRQALERETAAAAQTAALVGQRLDDRLQALQQVAQQLPAGAPPDRASVEALIAAQPLLRARFSNVFVADAQGRFVAYHDAAGHRKPTTPLTDRAYFREALATGRPVISEPVLGRVSGEPVVILVHPLPGRAGSTDQGPPAPVGILGGALRLASRDLLADLIGDSPAHASASAAAALTVVADRDGRIIVHPQRALLMQPLALEPRLARAVAQWQDGERTPGQALSQPGEVVAMAQDPLHGWQVWRAVSHDTLLAPVAQARSDALRAAVAIALALTGLLVGFMAWQLRPLGRLQAAAQALLQGTGASQVTWPEADGEIGQLARTLRHVWAERTQMESFNAQVLAQLHSVMAAAPVGLAFTRNGRFELVSAECCRLLAREETELVGQMTQRIFAANADHPALGAGVRVAFEAGQPYVGEWQLLRADGHTFWARLRARPVAVDDPGAGTIWSINDISDQVAARTRLEHAALHDALTAVANRKGFELQLRAVMARRGEGHVAALVMLDLDGFKPVNDTHGHAAGDALLVAVAQTLSRQVRGSDVVARLGGDEFALLLPACDLPVALRLAEKVRRAVKAIALDWEGHTLNVGVSLGVAALQASHADGAQWLAAADEACYAAKRGGRNQVCAAPGQLAQMAGSVSATVLALHEATAG